jgi:hypothetical protein
MLVLQNSGIERLKDSVVEPSNETSVSAEETDVVRGYDGDDHQPILNEEIMEKEEKEFEKHALHSLSK